MDLSFCPTALCSRIVRWYQAAVLVEQVSVCLNNKSEVFWVIWLKLCLLVKHSNAAIL